MKRGEVKKGRGKRGEVRRGEVRGGVKDTSDHLLWDVASSQYLRNSKHHWKTGPLTTVRYIYLLQRLPLKGYVSFPCFE